MNKDLLEKMDMEKIKNFRVNIIHLNSYCRELKSRFANNSYSENTEKGKNGFKALCSMMEYSDKMIKIINRIAQEKNCTFDAFPSHTHLEENTAFGNTDKNPINQADCDKLTSYHKLITGIIDYCWEVEGNLVDLNHSYFYDINDISTGDNGFEEFRNLIDSAMSMRSFIDVILRLKRSISG